MNSLLLIGVFFITGDYFTEGCLITNCPRGGKRSGKMTSLEGTNVKQCLACGPGRIGQCFGSKICCGPFGCLVGTPETLRCQREGFFHESEPCIAGNSFCRKNTGRCAAEGICCSQDSCYIDKSCTLEDKRDLPIFDIYNLLSYQSPIEFPTE
ncbi:Neurohypophysial hormone, N-terminal Domain [Popillia japonica]|uniref:Neurohypophysial hormone, N-terminal Domain n=1 Tax=Popillia japonica TaxID=7064 RepID=A0AAW1L6E2_POPJA